MAVEPTALQPSSIVHRLSSTSSPEWDHALLSAHNPSLLQSWRWGEFKRQSGWSPYRLSVADTDGPLSSAIHAQVLFRSLPRLPFSIAYIPRGPVYTHDTVPNE